MIGLIFGIAFGLCGLFAILLSQKLRARDREMENWPRASGRIASIDLETRNRRFEDARGMYYDADVPVRVIKYTYEVGGRQLTGVRYEGTIQGSRNTPIETKYSVGQEVQVSYDPQKPEIGYIEPPFRSKGAAVIGVLGAVFLAIGILVPALMNLLS